MQRRLGQDPYRQGNGAGTRLRLRHLQQVPSVLCLLHSLLSVRAVVVVYVPLPLLVAHSLQLVLHLTSFLLPNRASVAEATAAKETEASNSQGRNVTACTSAPHCSNHLSQLYTLRFIPQTPSISQPLLGHRHPLSSAYGAQVILCLDFMLL